MARVRLPKNLGDCEIITTKAGSPAIWNRKSGKNRFLVACRNLEEAEQVLQRIKESDKQEEIWL
ncbi:hypothetical protein [Pseudomonas sp. SO81]|uniref:hypothetical protein n=1 Tax=Pseudomonas sp. SO81 TaxID=2983246 RepID=UPI0025A43D51|nr:hypothetical protein [Pseudomonas sp. SO81]WJN58149.1 hypothetical protein OH686_05350 [Pseudomonas sp. SO81]